jgi:hypothetical protein
MEEDYLIKEKRIFIIILNIQLGK